MNKFLQEILEQPKSLSDTLNFYLEGDGRIHLEKIVQIWKSKKFEQIIFTGMGSSFFASHAAACMLSRSGIKSFVVNAGELLHYHFPIIQPDSLLVCVSQSGESFEVVKILENIPQGITCIGISNEEESSVIKNSTEYLLCRAGKEEMTSTKTYISTALVMFIFSLALAGEWNDAKREEMAKLVGIVEEVINNKEEWLGEAMKVLGDRSFVQIIGRGTAYASVQQSALMFKEGARNPSAGIYGGEFRHGPLEMVKEGFKAIVFAPIGKTYQQSIKLIEDITKFGGEVIKITNSNEVIENNKVCTIKIPYCDEDFFSIPGVIPVQFLVNEWALESGIRPGDFTRGAKVTVIE